MKFLAVSSGVAWTLLGATLLAVLAFYLLRPSPRRIGIASNVIWQRVLKAHQRDRDRLRWWLSLLLAGLIAAAAALACTQPEWAAVSGGARRLLVVLDNASSMSARTLDGRTRWDHAQQQARTAIESAGAGSQFMVLDTQFQAGAPVWEKRNDALARLARLQPSLGKPRFPKVTDTTADARVFEALFITDGVARLQAPADYRVVSVFERATNIGVTAFEIRPQPADPRRYEAYLEVFNASSSTEQPELTLTGVDGKSLRQAVAIPGNSTASAVIDVSAFPPGPVRAAVVSGNDGYDPDNNAFSFVPGKNLIRVALVTRGNPVLERALRLQPRLELTILSSPRVSERDGFDAVIFDRVQTAEAVTFPAIYIRPQRLAGTALGTGEIKEATVNVWEAQHPVMENLTLRDVVVDTAARWRPEDLTRAHAVVLASDAGKGALIAASVAEPYWIATSFDLSDSNLPLLTGFPVMLSNTLRWLTGEAQALVKSPGWVDVPLPRARVLGLDGKEVSTRTLAGGVAFEAPAAGFYTAVSPERVLRVAVNLFDMDAIAINRSELRERQALGTATASGAGKEPWMVLLAVVLALLTIEWLTYHRKLTV